MSGTDPSGPEHLEGYAKALLNILDDADGEKQRLGDAQRAMLNILEDLDEEKTKVEATNRELARSNSELEQFAYVASHDLQEPLRMVSSYTQLLEQRYGDALDEKARKYIYYAVDGASRMQRLITDLLSYSRVASRHHPFAPTDSHSALGEAIRNLSSTIAETQALVTNGELPTVMANRSLLVQLFQNLVGNAIKFRGKESPRIQVSAVRKDGEWVFCVRDNGIGIDPQYFDRIFVIFQRLHAREEYPGTGIGLALCKRIVERHGGRIWVESRPGEGSAFFFSMRCEEGENVQQGR